MVKALLDRGGRTDQDILAYFTRPTRSVNHRAIIEIRTGTKHTAVPAASQDDLSAFLASWPEIDHTTGLSLRGDELLIKAREAMIAAVHTFNGAGLHFRAELFIVTAVIAWTYLHHAFYKREGVDYRYRQSDPEADKTERGAERYWELGKCVRSNRCPLDKAVKSNLEFVLGLRHEIEHRSTNRIDDAVSAQLQSCAINFNDAIKGHFGEQFGLERRLPIALQFVTFSPDHQEILKRAGGLPPNVSAMMDAFHDHLSEEEAKDTRFAFRVALVPITVNRVNQADVAYRLVQPGSDDAKQVADLILKETEKKKWLPGQIVTKMHREGYRSFNTAHHTRLWQSMDARNPGKGFGVSVYGKGQGDWAWYDRWVDVVRTHCEQNASRYGKPVSNDGPPPAPRYRPGPPPAPPPPKAV